MADIKTLNGYNLVDTKARDDMQQYEKKGTSYSKTEADDKYYDKSDTYSKSEIDGLVSPKMKLVATKTLSSDANYVQIATDSEGKALNLKAMVVEVITPVVTGDNAGTVQFLVNYSSSGMAKRKIGLLMNMQKGSNYYASCSYYNNMGYSFGSCVGFAYDTDSQLKGSFYYPNVGMYTCGSQQWENIKDVFVSGIFPKGTTINVIGLTDE